MSPSETVTRTCDKHGDYEARKTGSWVQRCPTCSAEAETARRERERDLQEEEKRLARERRREQWLRECGAVGRFKGANFESFRAETKAQRQVRAACERFVDEFPQTGPLWLLGNVGTGKTLLGCIVVQQIIQRREKRALIATPREIIRRLRETWRKDAEEREQDVLDDLVHCPLLVLDEVGVSFGTDTELVQLYDIVDGRYRHENPTLVISNLSPSGLRDALGDRIFDRLREGTRVLVCDWPSHRGAASSNHNPGPDAA